MTVTIQDVNIGDNGEVAKDKINQNAANLNEAVIPTGGTVDQVLKKLSASDYDMQWVDFILAAQNWIDFTPQGVPPAYTIGRIFYDDTENTWTAYNDLAGISLQLGEELRARLVNDTGGTLLNGAAVSVVGAVGASLKVELLDSSVLDLAIRGFGLITLEVLDGDPSYCVRFGAVRSLDTSLFSVGDIVYSDPEAPGGLINTRPVAPNYPVRIGLCLISDPIDGVIAVDTLAFNGSDTTVNIEGTLNGVVVETPKVDFYESAGGVWVEITNQNEPTKNLPFIIGGMRYLLNTLTGGGPNGGAFAQLVTGADSSTLFENFIYVWLNGVTPELKVSTLSTPDTLAPIGKASLFDYATTIARGRVPVWRRYNDAPDNGDADGFNRWLADLSRDKLGTTYTSGIDATVVVNSTPSITISTTAGVAMQAHKSAFSLQDGTSYSIYNDSTNTVTYAITSDLATIVQTASGQSLAVNGAYYRLKVYGIQNSNSGGALAASDLLLVTRPLGFYASQALAFTDASNYDVSINDIITEGLAFPLYTLVIGRTGGGGGTWTLIATQDNRTRLIGGVGGGGAQGGGGTDDKIGITAVDTTPSYGNDKLTVTTNLLKSIVNPGGNEQLLFDIAATINKLIGFGLGVRIDPNQTFSLANGLTFGDGNTGFYESSDNSLNITIAGTNNWRLSANLFRSNAANGVTLRNLSATGTTPSIAPSNQDLNTGLGWAGADQLSLIAGGVECARIEVGVQKFYGQAVGGDETKTFAATPEFDFNDGNTQQITLTANITSWTIANELPSGQYTLYFIQDTTGGWTITDPTSIDYETNNSIADFSTLANAINIVNVFVMPDGTTAWSLVEIINP